ncbi:MAG TPA: DUF4399 domain-containing protein [Aliidongia sp.]|nr:DUF4399 domain-containing protein [Aliidongia sp.]
MRRILGLGAMLAAAIMLFLAAPADAQTPSVPGAKVFFVNIKDGDTVKSPFKVEFGLTGMKIAKAGDETPGTGHHHLLIDTKLSPEELTQPIANDDTHKHYGGGQTEATITLPPGKHTLQLVLGDWSHVPHQPPVMSQVITVNVQ